MKQVKTLALFATVALGAMSCSNNEIIETLNEQNEIRFASVQMGNNIITRAAAGNGDSFGVYAYVTQGTTSTNQSYFINEKLIKTETDATWGLGKKFFYPNGDFSMKFIAYGKKHNTVASELGPTSSNGATLTYKNWDVTTKDSDVCESFVVTKSPVTITQDDKNDPVSLTFTHALSKILFNANIKDDDALNITAKITSIKINTAKTGTLTVGDAIKWVPETWVPGTSESLSTTLTEAANKLTKVPTSVTSEYYVIPLEKEDDTRDITVEAEVVHNYSDGKPSNIVVAKASATITATGAQLAINNSVTYNITLDLSAAGLVEIKFAEPTIENWSPVDGGQSTFPTQP